MNPATLPHVDFACRSRPRRVQEIPPVALQSLPVACQTSPFIPSPCRHPPPHPFFDPHHLRTSLSARHHRSTGHLRSAGRARSFPSQAGPSPTRRSRTCMRMHHRRSQVPCRANRFWEARHRLFMHRYHRHRSASPSSPSFAVCPDDLLLPVPQTRRLSSLVLSSGTRLRCTPRQMRHLRSSSGILHRCPSDMDDQLVMRAGCRR